MAAKTWKAFEEEYKLIRQFGVKALQNKLNLELQKQGKTSTLNQKNVMDLVHQVIRNPEIDARLNHAFEQDLEQARQMLEQKQTPRGDNKPEVTHGTALGASPSFKPAPWTKNMDLAADPKVRDAIQNIVDNPNMKGRDLTMQFNNVMDALENKLKNEYKNRLKNAPRPTPGRPRPEPGK